MKKPTTHTHHHFASNTPTRPLAYPPPRMYRNYLKPPRDWGKPHSSRNSLTCKNSQSTTSSCRSKFPQANAQKSWNKYPSSKSPSVAVVTTLTHHLRVHRVYYGHCSNLVDLHQLPGEHTAEFSPKGLITMCWHSLSYKSVLSSTFIQCVTMV